MVKRWNTSHFYWVYSEKATLCNNLHPVSPRLSDALSDFFFISWQLIIKLIRSKSLFLWYSFTFNVVITHEIITFQDIFMDKIPKDFTSIKDTNYAALMPRWYHLTHGRMQRWCIDKSLGMRSKRYGVQFPLSPLRFQRLVIPCFQVTIWLSYRKSDWRITSKQNSKPVNAMWYHFIIPSQQRWRGYSNAAVRGWLGLWNAKLTETQIFRELSIEIESSLFN